jgi:hypothetical protein
MSIERTITEVLATSTIRGGCLKYWEPGDESPLLIWTHDWRLWKWPGKPFTVRFKERKLPQAFHVVDYQIRQAGLAECLTSTVPYIRECKKWFHEHDSSKS